MQITFTIPDAQAHRVVDALNGIWPKPDWFEGTEAQWAKELIRRYIIEKVNVWERNEAGSAIAKDENLVT